MSGLNSVNQKIDEILFSGKNMREIMKYVTAQKGKQLRPIMCLSAAQFGKKENAETVLFSAIIEIIHMASLIHDDIIDKADLRRGVPSVQKKFGVEMAVYAGDYMLASAFNACREVENINRYRFLFDYFKKLVDGEINQYFKSYDLNITEEEYFQNIYGKTACLFEFACVSGAKTASASKRIISAVKAYGYHFGILFQIRDDILNYKTMIGEEKPCMNDFENGIYTLPLIYAAKDYKNEIQVLKETISEKGFQSGEQGKLLSVIRDANVLAKCKQKAKEYYAGGITALEKLPDNEAKITFSSLLDQLYQDILRCEL